MKFIILLFIAVFALTISGQTRSDAPKFNLDFENASDESKLPDGWLQWGSGYDLKIDRNEKKSGKASLLIEPNSQRDDKSFSVPFYRFPAEYAGEEIELRGFLKLKDVADGFAGLFLRIDGEQRSLAIDNMESRKIQGTADWAEYSIKLPLSKDATFINAGAILSGTGKLWVDDLRILIGGKDISEAKSLYKAVSDKEFDAGSGISAIQLNESKIKDLDVLGRVWGFLKYHHPTISRGDYNWDYELFRILPKILNAKNRAERNEILSVWTDSLGAFETTVEAGKIKAEKIKLSPDLSWIDDKTLGNKLARQLSRVKAAKRESKGYYIGFSSSVGNPLFNHEEHYKTMTYPDAGFRLLCLFRYWNIVQYFYPNRHLIGENWNNVLPEFIPRFITAGSELEYKKAALALIGRIHDTHANIWGIDPTLDKFRGLNSAPVRVEFVEGKAIVAEYWDQIPAAKSGLKIGDVIESVNGKRVSEIVREKLPLTPASNRPTQLRDIARELLQTNENSLAVKIRRSKAVEKIKLETFQIDKLKIGSLSHRQIAPFKLIRPDIAYLYPGSLKEGEIKNFIPEIAKTKGLIVDMRCYPSDFIVFSLGEFLMPKPTDFVRFSRSSSTTPGLFTMTAATKVGKDNADYYKGKVVILVNEITQSNAEYTTMALRRTPRAIVIGSTTAGADGNVSRFYLPGEISTFISGIGVYYPDGKETQRIGIVPDIWLKPTITGIRDGRDELLEKALEVVESN